jgi:hypothetical protein
MAEVKIRVKGTYALMTHNPASMAMSGDKDPSKKGGKKIPTPSQEAEMGCYHLESGGYGLPGFAFRNSILSAAADWQVEKKRYTYQRILSSLMVLEDLVPLIDDKGKLIKNYLIDTRRVLIQGQGILRSRPKFPEWGAEFTLEYDETLIKEHNDYQKMLYIIVDAGKRIGVGDYRPQKIKGAPGPFGRYALVRPTPE